jgi:hypothetical protein
MTAYLSPSSGCRVEFIPDRHLMKLGIFDHTFCDVCIVLSVCQRLLKFTKLLFRWHQVVARFSGPHYCVLCLHFDCESVHGGGGFLV